MKGSIVKKGATYFAIIETSAIDPATGKPKRRRKWFKADGAKNKGEAQTFLRTKLTELEGGVLIDAKKIKLAEYFERWLDHARANVSPKSHERYTEVLRKNVAPLIGSVILAKLQPIQISEAYARALSSGRRNGKGGLSPRTVHHMHTILKASLAQAVKWNLLTRNPCDAVDPPKVERAKMTIYDMSQTVAVLDALRPTRMYVPTLLAVLCGMRRGEICALRWKHVDLDRATISVVESAEQTKVSKGKSQVRYKEPKTGKGRSVALSGTVVEELRAWRLRQAQEFLRIGSRPADDSFVVTREDCEPIQPNSITHEWTRLLAGTALPRARLHDMRHSHATQMLKEGVHPKIASERLGHSKVGVTLDLYSHVLPGMQEDAVAKVDAAFRKARGGV
jgi:integrase